MKKLILAASLFFAIAISAQEAKPQHNHKERPTVEQQMREFDGINLTNKQRSKLEKLYKERDAEMEKNRPEPPKDGDRNGNQNRSDRQAPPPPPPSDSEGSRRPNNDSDMRNKMDKQRAAFDKKVQKILNQDQYAQYQANQKKHHDMMTKESNGKQLKERPYDNSNQ